MKLRKNLVHPSPLKVDVTDERSAFVSDVKKVRQRIYGSRNRHVIYPTNKWVHRFNFATGSAVLFTSIVTPVEIAFGDSCYLVSFVIHRVIDAIFTCDIILNFHLAYYEGRKEFTLVRDHCQIARNYILGWFIVDLASVLPFDIIACYMEVDKNHPLSAMATIRMIRLLRLVKLVKMMNATNLAQRIHVEYPMQQGTYQIAKFMFLIMLFCHWFACLWGVTAIIGSLHYQENWMSQHDRDKPYVKLNTPFEKYAASLYWAVYTLTGTGYGDIVAQNPMEYIVCATTMCISAVFWAYMIGKFSGILATLDPHNVSFRQNLDEMNLMMEDQRIPNELRHKVRMFIHQSKDLVRHTAHMKLQRSLPFSLRCELAASTLSKWVHKVWYFESASREFLGELAQTMVLLVFSPQDLFDSPETLYILRRGVAAHKGRPLVRGSVFGSEFILESNEKTDRYLNPMKAIALTYVEAYSLTRSNLYEILEVFPKERAEIKRARKYYSAKVSLIHFAEEVTMGRMTRPSDFMTRFELFDPTLKKDLKSRSSFTRRLNSRCDVRTPLEEMLKLNSAFQQLRMDFTTMRLEMKEFQKTVGAYVNVVESGTQEVASIENKSPKPLYPEFDPRSQFHKRRGSCEERRGIAKATTSEDEDPNLASKRPDLSVRFSDLSGSDDDIESKVSVKEDST